MVHCVAIRSGMISVVEYNVDYSDVKGRKVECPEGCGLCCLCQPEVLPEERQFFRENHPNELVKSKGADHYTALALKKGCGSCVFLNNRRCKVYDHRTSYCRQFPYHIYVSDKVKVELDLSCRGAWTGNGNDAVVEAEEIVERANGRIISALMEATDVYRQFYANCKAAGVMGKPEELRKSVSDNLMNFTDLAYLSKVMESCEMEASVSLKGLQKVAKLELADLEEAARDSALESMATDDPLNAPVYCDADWKWNVFLSDEEMIEWNILDDEGDLHHQLSANVMEIPLKPLEADGVKVLADYIATLNGRDSFMGSVFALMDSTGYEDDMSNAYYGCLCTSILDLLWRASMLDFFMGTGMGAEGIREAIIFYDMDRLDAPTIGAFV